VDYDDESLRIQEKREAPKEEGLLTSVSDFFETVKNSFFNTQGSSYETIQSHAAKLKEGEQIQKGELEKLCESLNSNDA